MPRSLAQRLSSVVPSATLAMNARAQALRASGIDVISFGAGEPDFDTPSNIRDAGKRAIDEGKTRYTPTVGIPDLRKAIAAESTRRRSVVAAPENVIVPVGAKSALFNFAFAAVEPGDEVIIPAPYWVSYPEQVRMAGGTPVYVPSTLESGWKISPRALAEALTPRTKAFILCTPCNPTGAAYTSTELAALADVLRRSDCWVVIDEIYSQLVYDGFEQRSLLTVAADLAERIVLVDGVSKTYAMTGWRIGWSIATSALTKAMDIVQGQGVSSPATICQYAALEALTSPARDIEMMRNAFAARRVRLRDGMCGFEGVRCALPEGAFYLFCDVRTWIGKHAGDRKLLDDVAIAEWLLDTAHVAVVPGGAFGAPGHLRLSYVVSDSQIDRALERIRAAVAALK